MTDSATTDAHTQHIEILHQLFSAATHDASAAMCRWTSGLITLTLDEVREIPLEEASMEYDIGDELLTMVVLTIESEVGGTMILTFDDESGRKVAANILRREIATTPEWTELEQSAIKETGNILGCAYMNAITRLINHELVPSPPMFVQDYGASVLQQALMLQAADSEQVLICRTRFHRDGEELSWNVFFMPNAALRDAMHHSNE